MTIPAEEKLHWIQAASLVVQVAIEGVEAVDVRPGELAECTVTGSVVRVFVGEYERQARIAFRMSVYSDTPPPGDCFEDLARLREARFVEAYLDRDDVSGTWSARDTLLVEDLCDEPVLVNWLHQAVARGASPQPAGASTLAGLLRRLLGRD